MDGASSAAGRRRGKTFQFATDLRLEGCFGGKVEFVAAGENLFLRTFAQRVFHDGVVFVGAEDEAERGIVAGRAFLAVVVIDVELELTEVLVGELADFQVEEDVAL